MRRVVQGTDFLGFLQHQFLLSGTRRSGLGREPLLDLVATGHAADMHHLAIDDDAGRAHHAVAHDVAQLLDLFEFDGDAFGFSDSGSTRMVALQLAQPVPRTLMSMMFPWVV